MLADPVSDGAVRQAGVGLLVASGEVGDLGAVDHPLGHAVAWHRALPASTVAIATSGVLDVVATHTAPESVKRVKSIEQILVKNKMEAERLSQC